MDCFDWRALGNHVDAVAICADGGAAVCHDHAHVTARWLTRAMLINRVVAVDPPRAPSAARTVRATGKRDGCSLRPSGRWSIALGGDPVSAWRRGLGPCARPSRLQSVCGGFGGRRRVSRGRRG